MLAGVPNRLGQADAIRRCREAGSNRVHIFDLENHAGTPVYVHAKACVVDDTWATIGSDNLNRRSWTHDSELTAAVLDTELDNREPTDPRGDGTGARVFARDLRLRLVREHLDRADGDDDDLIDPDDCVSALDSAADALDAWHLDGRRGERPPGRLRRHEPTPVGMSIRLWATPVYRWLHDPDGRPLRLRRAGTY
jgi:phosphatidylserine/phosphatidylglycerophosphate/cardiolipin synthase-like enzyme